MTSAAPVICVVIPAYKVREHVLGVIDCIPASVSRIYVVDDACPDHSGDFVQAHCSDARVQVLRNPVNLGVGGAVVAGYAQALADQADIVVKVDGDGQMAPALIPRFVAPLVQGKADYTKGNRFFDLRVMSKMPLVRLVGNAGLSFMTKLSTGYWNIFDPTNGYTAIHRRALSHLPLESISKRYFFETDMLFRLNTLRAVVRDINMEAVYGDEKSSLSVTKVLPEFAARHAVTFAKRIFYNYFLRDFSIASVELVAGVCLLTFGVVFGATEWLQSIRTDVPSTAGTVMISALSVLLGLQLVLAFLAYDISSTPRVPMDRS